jgi:hypothetical protein
MGRPRECFRNAATLALRNPNIYIYVEGYAVNTWIAMHTMAHAWCINSDDFAVDPTWDEGTEYFGVPFRHDYLRQALNARRDYGLIDNPEMDFPLVTGAQPMGAEHASTAEPSLHEPRKRRASWTRKCGAKRQERKRQARATHASTRHGRVIHYEPRLRRRRGE